jgi:hypothetical protein
VTAARHSHSMAALALRWLHLIPRTSLHATTVSRSRSRALLGTVGQYFIVPFGTRGCHIPPEIQKRLFAPFTRGDQSALTIEKLTQDLQKAGFSEVKVLEDAFLVQAKTKDGNPILMTIGPHGMSGVEFSNVNGTSQDRAPQTSDKSSAVAPKAAQQH